jgi:hypothetical protein
MKKGKSGRRGGRRRGERKLMKKIRWRKGGKNEGNEE